MNSTEPVTSFRKPLISFYGGRRNPLMLESVAWGTALALTLFALYFPPFRYLEYLVPFVALIYGLADGRFRVPEATRPFVALACAGIALLPLSNSEGYKDLFFIVSGISLSLVLNKVRISPYALFWMFVVGNVLNVYQSGGFSGGLVFNFMDSESTFEGNFAFLFGLLTVYAAITRQWKLLYLSFFASVLALKRITIFAEIVCVLLALMPSYLVKRLLNPIVMVVINLLFVAILLLYATHTFDYMISQMTGQSANQFGLGRQVLYGQISQLIENNPVKFIFLGQGPGASYELLMSNTFAQGYSNLHSDLLKILYEYGFLVFGIFIALGYSSRHLSLRLMFLYANIVFISDNVLIYHFFTFFFCMFGLVLAQREDMISKGGGE